MTLATSVWTDGGGVGKTTLTVNTANALAERGDVLLIDLDPQTGGLTDHCGFEAARTREKYNLVDALVNGDRDLSGNVIRGEKYGGLNVDLIPSHKDLKSFGDKIRHNTGPKEDHRLVLYEGLASVYEDYDYILIDNRASRGLLVENSLAATQSVLIPTEGSRKGVQGVSGVITYINDLNREIRSSTGKDLAIQPVGIVPNRLAKTGNLTKLDKWALSTLLKNEPDLTPDFFIPDLKVISDAWREQQSLKEYFNDPETEIAARNRPLLDYYRAVGDIIEAGSPQSVDFSSVKNIPDTLYPNDDQIEVNP